MGCPAPRWPVPGCPACDAAPTPRGTDVPTNIDGPGLVTAPPLIELEYAYRPRPGPGRRDAPEDGLRPAGAPWVDDPTRIAPPRGGIVRLRWVGAVVAAAAPTSRPPGTEINLPAGAGGAEAAPATRRAGSGDCCFGWAGPGGSCFGRAVGRVEGAAAAAAAAAVEVGWAGGCLTVVRTARWSAARRGVLAVPGTGLGGENARI